MSENIINALPRTDSGKGAARQLRRHGRIPGVFYIGSGDSIPLSVDNVELTRLLKNRHTLVQLALGEDNMRECVIRDIQHDPVDERIVHIDFMGITRGQKITVEVPVKLIGTPIGVKTDGGILQHGPKMVSVECLPSQIPEELVVDVTDLKIGQSVFLEKLERPELRLLGDPRLVLATVVAPVVTRDEKPAAAAEAAATEAPAENG